MAPTPQISQIRPGPKLVVLAILLIVTCAAYWGGLHGPFLFDDFPNIVENQYLSPGGVTLADLWASAFSSESSSLQRPATVATFVFQTFFAGGMDAFAFKLGNLFLHCVNTALVFFTASKLFAWLHPGDRSRLKRVLAPALAAACWGLNPLLVSTVLYPVQRMAILSATFSLAATLVYLGNRISWARSYPTWDELGACFFWVLLLLVVGVLAKENAALTMLLIAGLELSLFCGVVAGGVNARLKRSTEAVLLLGIVTAAGLLVSYWSWIEAGFAVRSFSVWERLLTQSRLLWMYLDWFFLPSYQSLGMFHDDVVVSTSLATPTSTLLSILGWIAAIVVSWCLRARTPELLLALIWYLAAHALESSVLALELVFEHRNYLPSVGPALAFGLLSARLLDRGWYENAGWVVCLIPTALVVGMALETAIRANVWGEEVRLARNWVEKHPASERSALAYGNALLRSAADSASADDRDRYVALAKHEFEFAAQLHSSSIAILAMRLNIDLALYGQSGEADTLLAQLMKSINEQTLTATDFAAINSLVECYLSGECQLDAKRLGTLLEVFEQKFWRPADVARLRYRVYVHAGPPSIEERESMISEMQAAYGISRQFLPLQMELQAETADIAGLWLSLSQMANSSPTAKYLPKVSEAVSF